MAGEFDAGKIETAGWRQGVVLGEEVAEIARKAAPEYERFDVDWLSVSAGEDVPSTNLSTDFRT